MPFGVMLLFNTSLALRTIDDLLIIDPSRRLAAVIERCVGAEMDSGTLSISQTELGNLSRVSRKLVNRFLGDFENRGWLQRGYNRVDLINGAALAAYAHEK